MSKSLFKKIIAITIVVGILLNMCVFAADVSNELYEIYNIEYVDGKFCIAGRHYGVPDDEVTLNVTNKDTGEALEEQMVTADDGSFEFVFDAELNEYSISIKAETIAEYKADIDLGGLSQLFVSGGDCTVDKISFEYDCIKLFGRQSGGENVWVTFKVVERDASPSLPTSVKAIEQAQSLSDGTYELEFYLAPGQYTAYIQAVGQTEYIADFAVSGISDLLSPKRETATAEICEKYVKILTSYCGELETLLAECEAKGISVDYERINYSVIVRFIEQMKNEANHEYYDLLATHYYALIELYNEAKTSLEGYLNGEEAAFKVPRYITSDIAMDGYGLKATTYDGADYDEDAPVFFIGPGVAMEDKITASTLKKDIEFLSDCGFNYLEIGTFMKEFYFEAATPTARRIGNWKIYDNAKGTTGYSVSNEASHSGEHSLKITRTEPWAQGSHRSMRQTLSVKPNTTYVIGAKVKADKFGGMYFWFAENDGVKKAAGTYDWTDVSFEYTTKNGEATAEMGILVDIPVKALYIDDVYVYEKGTDVNLIEDGSFEETAKINTQINELIENDEYLSKLRAEAQEEGWGIDYYGIMELIDFLKIAEEKNYLVNIMLDNAAITGTFIMSTEPGMADGYHRFLPYLIDHPMVKKALRIYTQTVLYMIKDCKSVYEVSLLNEPSYDVRGGTGTYYIPEWQEYLEEKYGTIDALNKAYGLDDIVSIILEKNYKSFAEVPMPAESETSPFFYDWRCFNDEVLTRFIKEIFSYAREAAPDFKYHTKVMNYMRRNNIIELTYGTNYEMLKDTVDINGNDSIARDFTEDDYRAEWTMLWYDFQTSLKKATVANNENHVLKDTSEIDLGEQWSPWINSQIWNGAVHRMGMSSIWLWDTSEANMPWGEIPHTNFAIRARDIANLGKTTLDINRLAKEITAIQNVEPNTALLYSRTAEGYNKSQSQRRSDAYAELLYNGQKVGFITDTTSDEISKYKLVVIPESTNVPETVLNNVLSYLKNGGRVLMLGDTSFKKDEHNTAHDEAIVNEIYSLATVVDVEDMKSGIASAVQEAGLDSLVLKDAETGEKIDKTEWAYAEYNGNIIVNILNYEWSDKRVKLEYKGKEIENFAELRSGEKYEDTITLSPYTPALVKVNGISVDRVDEDGNVLEYNIDTLEPGIMVKCNSLMEGQHITAFYSDDRLVLVGIDTPIKLPEILVGNYRLMSTVWEEDTLRPLTKPVYIMK